MNCIEDLDHSMKYHMIAMLICMGEFSLSPFLLNKCPGRTVSPISGLSYGLVGLNHELYNGQRDLDMIPSDFS